MKEGRVGYAMNADETLKARGDSKGLGRETDPIGGLLTPPLKARGEKADKENEKTQTLNSGRAADSKTDRREDAA